MTHFPLSSVLFCHVYLTSYQRLNDCLEIYGVVGKPVYCRNMKLSVVIWVCLFNYYMSITSFSLVLHALYSRYSIIGDKFFMYESSKQGISAYK